MTKQLPYRVISLTKPKAGLAFSSLQHQGIKASLPCSDLIHAPLNVYRSRLCDGDSANTDGLISEALAFKNHFCLFNFFFPSWFPSPAPSLSHALTHSAWILAGTASAVKAAAVGIPLLPGSSWGLQMSLADWYCVLQFIWQIAFVAFEFPQHS